MNSTLQHPRPSAGLPPELLGPALGGLPPDLRAQVLTGCVEWTVPAGRMLLPQGQRADVCYGLATGMLRLDRDDANGRSLVLDLLEPGRWIGCTHVLADAPLPFGVTTVTRSTLLVLRKSTLQSLLEGHPAKTVAWLLAVAAAQADGLVAQLGMLATGSVEERVGWLLRVLAERHSVPAGGFRRILVPLTQTQMARIVGASRQRVNTTLGTLRRQGQLRIVAGWLELAGTTEG